MLHFDDKLVYDIAKFDKLISHLQLFVIHKRENFPYFTAYVQILMDFLVKKNPSHLRI